MIRIDNLTFGHGPKVGEAHPLFSGFNLSVAPGEHLVLAGPNGAGKSTLIRLMKGLLVPQEGEVVCSGRAGILFSHPADQGVLPVVEDDVAFGVESVLEESGEIARRVGEALEAAGVGHLRRALIHHLSGGGQQMVNLAGVLAMRPEVVLLDEGTAMLDPTSKRRFRSLIRGLHRNEGRTVVEATHDPLEILSADRVVVLKRGEIVFDGSPRGLWGAEEMAALLGLSASELPRLLGRLVEEAAQDAQLYAEVREIAAEGWGITS